jgi:hypothetical protein
MTNMEEYERSQDEPLGRTNSPFKTVNKGSVITINTKPVPEASTEREL